MRLRMVLVAALMGNGAAASGQETAGPNLAVTGVGAPGGVAQLVFAQDLLALALAGRDAQAALAAARLERAVSIRDVALVKDTRAPHGAGAEPAAPPPDPPGTAEPMLDAARRLAAGDESILTLVDQAAAEKPPGSLTAGRTQSRLDAGHEDVWTLPFYGGALAEIGLLGAGAPALHVRVSDETDTTICQASGPDATVHCDWYPAWNGYFTVTVSNRGDVPASYVLLTN